MAGPLSHSIPEPTGPETELSVRVSYAETDQMGVVNYGWYMRWLEMGRTEYIRQRGTTYKDLEQQGVFIPVAEVYLRYRQSARYDDVVTVYTSLENLTDVRMTFAYRVVLASDNSLLAYGRSSHPITNAEGKVQRILPAFREMMLAPPTV